MIIMIDLVLTSGSTETSFAENKTKRYKGGNMSASVWVYLKKSIEKEVGFKPESTDGMARFCGDTLTQGKGLYCMKCFGLGDKLPENLKKHLHHISCRGIFSSKFFREEGIYKRGGVRATLELKKDNDGLLRYEVEMEGKDMKQLRNTYEAIRAGTLFRPTISFEGKQRESRSEMAAKIEQLQETIARLKYDREKIASIYGEITVAKGTIKYTVKGRRRERDSIRETLELLSSAHEELIEVLSVEARFTLI
ncbi:hypothetical protein D4R86_02295 [bacterium]|nr:MAG: hypothetical protein D4R86_02295 [bacterium]